MASLERRGRTYRITFRLGGKKFQVTASTGDLRDANACRVRLEENLRLVERGRLAIPDGADVGLFLLSDGKLERRVESKQFPTVADLVARYRTTFTAGVKERSTVQTEKIHLGHFERVLGGRTRLSVVSPLQVQSYVDTRAGETYRGKAINPLTIKKEVATMAYVWNWARRLGIVDAPFPSDGLVFPKEKLKELFRTYGQIRAIVDRGGLSKAEIREAWNGLYLDAGQIADVLEHIRRRDLYPWLYPFCAAAAHTGARRSELLRSRVTDFDLRSRIVMLREKKRSRVRETFRTVEMTPFLERTMSDHLATVIPGQTHAFCDPDGRPLSGSNNMKAIRRVFKGSKWSVIRGYHIFRHSFVSVLAAGGTDQRVIDEMTGHQTDEMRRRYRHLTPDLKRAALVSAFDS